MLRKLAVSLLALLVCNVVGLATALCVLSLFILPFPESTVGILGIAYICVIVHRAFEVLLQEIEDGQ